ncbi:MAG: hypothetical protein A2157_07840 [Deltaproteobacteria bacterium RBG_16_47_11]|nr:MAG: hypothetical protein A2157_07840 [Deltaproteobacteria bacterium RBG_16_47_11]
MKNLLKSIKFDFPPYRRKFSHREAVAELRRHAGTQFDPHFLEKFIKRLETLFPESAFHVPAICKFEYEQINHSVPRSNTRHITPVRKHECVEKKEHIQLSLLAQSFDSEGV